MRTFLIATMTLAVMTTMMAATLHSGPAGEALARAEGFPDLAPMMQDDSSTKLALNGAHGSEAAR